MSEHYYGNVAAGNEPEECGSKDGRHYCFELPRHDGPHGCGRYHLDITIQCRVTRENDKQLKIEFGP